MEKVILVDGNNLLFRSYYATAYTGNMMRNSKGFPTNALYGFINMMNKIIKEEKPKYILVAFDIGKTFRHEAYEGYKDGRLDTPEDLKKQFPVAKEILNNMGIKYLEVENYEADDIIGTVAKMVDEEELFISTIVSSDKDLLQLISNDNEVKLLKTKDHIRMNRDVFFERYGIEPINMIDLKGLEGDPSDNIPGVKGIGEKTALKLLKEYKTIENIYDNIDKVKGSVHDKLVNDKDKAFFSKKLATIYKDVPINITFSDMVYNGEKTDELLLMYNDLEFFSLLKKEKTKVESNNIKTKPKIINNIDEIGDIDECSVYIEMLGNNYHKSLIIGISLYNKDINIFIPECLIKDLSKKTISKIKSTYDLKKLIILLKQKNKEISHSIEDVMIQTSLLNYNIKDDIAYLANALNNDIPFYENYFKKIKEISELNIEEVAYNASLKSKFIFETYSIFEEELKNIECLNLYKNIELPLVKVLADMEYNGINIDLNILNNIKEEIKIKLELIEKDIYNYAGVVFNIASPKQLGEILFEKLNLPHGKKNQSGYSTDIAVLTKLKNKHPIIDCVIEYRMLNKIYTTYVEGLLNSSVNNKIHTIYTQTLTRTGRLSSIEPNLQNIPIRYNEGRLIRKAFVPSKGSILIGADYSQIELRLFAHMSNNKELIDAFNGGMDIHTRTAMEVFEVDEDMVTKEMRRRAKAVNFGIIYGISSFGLSNDLDIDISMAKEFIEKYLDTFSGIREYMKKLIANCKEKGYVETIMGRRRYIDEINSTNYMIRSSGERMALNTPIQGSSADIIKKAMIEIYNKFNELNIKSKMILQVHDELIFDVLKEEKDIVREIVTNIMENTYKLSVPLRIEIDDGINWYEIK